MRKNEHGIVTYETADEVFSGEIISAFEDEGYYYIRYVPRFRNDEQAYKIKKGDTKAESIHVLDIVMAVKKNGAKQIDPTRITILKQDCEMIDPKEELISSRAEPFYVHVNHLKLRKKLYALKNLFKKKKSK